jgi:hypothetical protein
MPLQDLVQHDPIHERTQTDAEQAQGQAERLGIPR